METETRGATSELDEARRRVEQLEATVKELERSRLAEATVAREYLKALRRRELQLEGVYRSRSWRLTAPIRAVSSLIQSLLRPQAGSSAAPVASCEPIRGGRRLFIECTHTHASEINTGIQRVVRNVLRYAPAVARRFGYEVVPVVCNRGQLVHAETSRVLANKPRSGVGGHGWILGPPEKDSSAAAGVGMSLDLYDTHEGNLLLLLDSSWRSSIWPPTRRFKRKGGRVAGVMYDLIPISHPHTCDEPLVMGFCSWFNQYVGVTDLTVAISRHTAERFETYLAEQVSAGLSVSHAPVSLFSLGSELDLIEPGHKARASFLSMFPDDRHVFLSVGSIEPRKNHRLIVEAFERHWQEGGTATLVLIGERAWRTEDLIARIERHPAKGKQLFLVRDATDEELDHAYRNASALIMASEIEGFGLPVVEAFQRGLPVLCSDIPVFREIADGRASFFRLEGPDELAQTVGEFCAVHPVSERSIRKPQPWLSWAESTAQLVGGIVAALGSAANPRDLHQ